MAFRHCTIVGSGAERKNVPAERGSRLYLRIDRYAFSKPFPTKFRGDGYNRSSDKLSGNVTLDIERYHP